ncbi:MAG: tetraacyldisaccharide 4'-kinase [Armatimonadota bacterium]
MRPDQAVIKYLESVVYGDRGGLIAGIVRTLLRLLSVVYRAALGVYLFLFNSGIRNRHRLQVPVISIGNITAGGTGKTPMVQYLCRGLSSVGLHPAVLSYGYGGSLGGEFGIVSDKSNILLDAQTAGDEPVMLAQSLPGVPVLVCKHRDTSGKTAIENFGADVIVLDDGFQVWKLHRDADIVLLNAEKPFDNGYTLPAGLLREPVSALRRAGCIIVTGCSDTGVKDNLLSELERLRIRIPVFFSDYRPSAIISLDDDGVLPVEHIRGKRVFAVSSIGNPVSFERTLESTGAVTAGVRRYPDHYGYTSEDMMDICRCASDVSAEMIVTTEKDAVKLNSFDSRIPVMALRVEPELNDKKAFWQLIFNITGQPQKENDAV